MKTDFTGTDVTVTKIPLLSATLTLQSPQHKSKYKNLCWNVKLVWWIALNSECFPAHDYQRTVPHLSSLISTKWDNHLATWFCTVEFYPSIATNGWMPRKSDSRPTVIYDITWHKKWAWQQIRKFYEVGKILRKKQIVKTDSWR